MQTLHSNDIRLDEPHSPMYAMVDTSIDVVYRPWEEIEANVLYKIKKKEQTEQIITNDTQESV